MALTPDDLLSKYEGHIVPRAFNPGFIALSYIVSLIGAACTLELLNRRTSHKGRFNHVLLVTSAVSMGGIAIWSMHFIGNRAIDLVHGEPRLQISYSSGFTAMSFFVPIAVLMTAFLAIGTNNTVSWWRVTIGGVLAGAAICGMHYLGNNSIYNYHCVYKPVNVIGSAIIAVAASIVSLALFFVFRAAWTNTWWKRAVCSVVLAGAVSGMHWVAATGTDYRLRSLSEGNNELSRNTTVIVVICLSICACLVMAGVAIYTARVMRRYANKAQQVVLAAAVFDQQGRILVNPDGLVPSEKITDTFLERNASDTFSNSHPLFHWMFRVSRNWSSISPLVGGMATHLAGMPRASRDRDSKAAVELIDEHGEMIPNYEMVLRELFCVAAVGLAEKMKEQLSSVGILWDEILPTGGAGQRLTKDSNSAHRSDMGSRRGEGAESPDDLAEKGLSKRKANEVGRGSLMFLVRRLQNERDVQKLEAAGYRFAELRQVSGIIGSSMQVMCWDFESKLQNMAGYAHEQKHLEPGAHLGFFGIRARVGSYGFDVLVRKDARNILPSVQLPISRIEPWQKETLQQLDGVAVSNLARRLEVSKRLSSREKTFMTQLVDAVQELRDRIQDPILDEALLASSVVSVPASVVADKDDDEGGSRSVQTSMIALRLVIPIHVKVSSDKCEFVPLNFFKIQQLVDSDTKHELTFAQSVHREFASVFQTALAEKEAAVVVANKQRHSTLLERPLPARLRRFGRPGRSCAVDEDGNPIPTAVRRSSLTTHSNGSRSTLKLWQNRRDSDPGSEDISLDSTPGYVSPNGGQLGVNRGGIMVSEEIRVEIHDAREMTPPPQAVGQGRFQRLLSRSMGQRDGSAPDTNKMQLLQLPGATLVTSGEGLGVLGDDGTMERFEMNRLTSSMGETRAKIHGGASIRVSNAHEASCLDVETFVDELFAICIDGR